MNFLDDTPDINSLDFLSKKFKLHKGVMRVLLQKLQRRDWILSAVGDEEHKKYFVSIFRMCTHEI